jgi:hypothetical protein
MEYKVIVVSRNSYNVKVTTKQDISSINVNTTPTIKLGQIEDVDAENIQNNQVMMYDQLTQKYKFVSAFEVLDRADGVDNDVIDFGSY